MSCSKQHERYWLVYVSKTIEEVLVLCVFIMVSKSVADACSIICLLSPSIVLQSCGFFSPFWIKHNATSTCYRGVIYNVGCPDNVEGRNTVTS